MNNAVIAQEGSPKDLYNFPKNKFVANFIGDANVVKAEIINKKSDIYELKLGEMSVNIESKRATCVVIQCNNKPHLRCIKSSKDQCFFNIANGFWQVWIGLMVQIINPIPRFNDN